MKAPKRNIYTTIVTSILLISIIGASSILPVRALTWGSAQKLGMSTLSSDTHIKFADASPSPGAPLRSDTKLKLADANGNAAWDPGEAVAYDRNLNSRYDPGEPVVAGAPTPSTNLSINTRLKVSDTNGNLLWDPGEAVVYDNNSNQLYDSGEPVIGGAAPPLQAGLVSEARIKFSDSNGNLAWDQGEAVVFETILNGYYNSSTDSRVKYVDGNSNNLWETGESVVYDTNSNNVFDPAEPLISWTVQNTGAPLKTDGRIKIVDSSLDGQWGAVEAVAVDTTTNSKYDSGEPIVSGAAPSAGSLLTQVPRIKYYDSNSNNILEKGEPVIYDINNNNYYNSSIDVKIRFIDTSANGVWDPGEAVIYDRSNFLVYDCLDTVIAGTAPPCFEEPSLNSDSKFKYADSNRNNQWDNLPSFEAVVYDRNSDAIYDPGDSLVTTTNPGLGYLLRDPLIAGTPPPLGVFLKTDPGVRFSDTNGDTVWDPTEPVVVDSNTDNIFQVNELLVSGIPPSTGTLLSEPLIAGSQPSIGSVLRSDAKIKFIDGNTNAAWNPGEIVAYDGNSSGQFDQGEIVIASAAVGTNGTWNAGEVAAYDANTDSVYNTGDSPITGSEQPAGTPLRIDAKVKFFDDNNNSQRDSVETVVYDSNFNNEYDSGEPVIEGTTPSIKLPEWPVTAPGPNGKVWLTWNEKTLGSVQNPDVFLRIWDGSSWTVKQKVTTDSGTDDNNFITPLFDQTMMTLWSSDRTGNPEIFYKTYSTGPGSPTPLVSDTQLTSNSMNDRSPTAVEDRNGRVWVAWTRRDAASPPTVSDIYYKFRQNGVWSVDFALPPASDSGLKEASPEIFQAKDGKIWILWSSNDAGNYQIYSTTTDGTVDTLPGTGIPASSWSAKRLMFSSNDEDDHSSLTQARDGIIWMFFQRTPTAGGQGPAVYSTSSSDQGANWSSPSQFAGQVDTSPSVGQMGDNRVWVFWTRQGATTDEIWFSKSDPITLVHDLGVRSVTAFPRFVKSGDPNPIRINTTVTNYGDFQESCGGTCQVTLKYNNTILATFPLTLASKQTQLINYNWTTTLGFWGRYILTATISTVAGENALNQADNTVSGGLVRISPPGDVDGDGDVDIFDAAALGFAYGTHPGDPLWNPNADIDRNNVINILDAALVGFYYGKSV